MLFGAPKKSGPRLPEISIAAQRVTLRPPQSEDWQEWVRVRRANQEFLKPFEPSWAQDWDGQDYFARKLARQIANWQSGLGQAFLIFKKDSGALIGGMNINNICRGAAQFASLGYWLDEAHQGQGLMAETLTLSTEYCFTDLALNRIHGACLEHNTRSRNLLLRGGFAEEGRAARYLQIDGRWQDHILYGLVRGRV